VLACVPQNVEKGPDWTRRTTHRTPSAWRRGDAEAQPRGACARFAHPGRRRL